MDFRKQKPIYLQIADSLCERMVAGEWKADERIPSVREVAVELGVNPNTVMRSFDYLQGLEVIYNRRGMGYFLSADAVVKIIGEQRKCFIEEEWPSIAQRMKMLGVTFDELSRI